MPTVPKPLTEPWAITAEGMQRVVDVWAQARTGSQVFGSLEAARAERAARVRLEEPGEPVKGTGGTLRMVGAVGVVSITGTLFRHANLISDFSGGTTYDALWRGIEAAEQSADCKAILLRVDSGGGEANGCGELGDYIRKVSASKPVWAYIEGMGCSAAYWLPSQASRMVAHRTAMIGSIGVRVEVIDVSEAEAGAGVKVLDMVSGGAPGKRGLPIDDAVLSRIQTKLDDLEAIFIDAVATGRKVSTDKVRADFGQGDYMVADKALRAGMIDDLGDFNSTLQALADSVAPASIFPSTVGAKAAASKPRRSLKAARTQGATMATADDDKKSKTEGEDDTSYAAEMEKCQDCNGTGEIDGKECEACGGKGEVEKKEPEASKAKADDDKKDDHAEPDGDEKARVALAEMAGLPAAASLRDIHAHLATKTTSLATVAKLQQESASLRSRLEALEGEKATAKAEQFVGKAIDEGRTMEDKRGHLITAFVAAEKSAPGSGPAAVEPHLFAKGQFTVGRRLTANGKPIGLEDKAPPLPGDAEADAVAWCKQKQKDKGISFSAAMDLLAVEAPELHAAYRASK